MKKSMERKWLKAFWEEQRPPKVELSAEESLEQSRTKHLKHTYGVSMDEYRRLVQVQGGVCAICFGRESDVARGCLKPLVVDHCHDSEEIRGLLCGPCNTMLGFSKDRPEVLEAGAAYLRARRENPLPMQTRAAIDATTLLAELRSYNG